MTKPVVMKYPGWRDLNAELKPLILSLSLSEKDFRLKQKPVMPDANWLDKHQYFPLESSWHSSDDLYTHEPFMPLAEFIKSIDPIGLNFISMWAKVASKGNMGSKHKHRGTVSGIYYVDIGHSEGSQKSGRVNFYFGEDKHTIEPSNGDIVIFPAWVFHDVEEYHGDGPRINISWNMM